MPFAFLILLLVPIGIMLYRINKPRQMSVMSTSSPALQVPSKAALELTTSAALMPVLVKKVKALVLMTSMYGYPSTASALYRILRQKGETGRFDTPQIQSILNQLFRDGSIARRRPHTGTNRQRRNATQYLLSAS